MHRYFNSVRLILEGNLLKSLFFINFLLKYYKRFYQKMFVFRIVFISVSFENRIPDIHGIVNNFA